MSQQITTIPEKAACLGLPGQQACTLSGLLSFCPTEMEISLDHSQALAHHQWNRQDIYPDRVAFILIAAILSRLQLKRLSAAVAFGGGGSLLLEEGSLPRQLLESPQSCVIDVTTGSSQAAVPSSSTEWAKSVKNIVQRSPRRCISVTLLMFNV